MDKIKKISGSLASSGTGEPCTSQVLLPGIKPDLTDYSIISQILKIRGTGKIPYFDLGLIGYSQAYDFQQKIFKMVQEGFFAGAILLLEHLPVITLGNNENRNNLLVDEPGLKKQGIELVQSNRGGDVTFHGPGQIVCYPVFGLSYFDKDITSFVFKLEQIIIDVLEDYKIKGTRIEKLRGVFVDSGKIASIGIRVKKWITFHGFSFNINVNLDYFDNIIACGLKDHLPVSLEKFLKSTVPVSNVKELIIEKFKNTFDIVIVKIYP